MLQLTVNNTFRDRPIEFHALNRIRIDNFGRCGEAVPKASIPAVLASAEGGRVPQGSGSATDELPENGSNAWQQLTEDRQVTPTTPSSPRPVETTLWDNLWTSATHGTTSLGSIGR